MGGLMSSIVAAVTAFLTSAQSFGIHPCRPFVPDTVFVRSIVDRLREGGPPAAQRDVQYRSIAVRSGARCATAVLVRWDGDRAGAVLVATHRDSILYMDEFADPSEMRLVGRRRDRVAFGYRSVSANGLLEYRFAVLCSFAGRWTLCLDLERLRQMSEPRHPVGPLDSVLDTRSVALITVVGDYVTLRRSFEWRIYGPAGEGPLHREDLGSSRLRIP
jgi:hypothetical protein